MGDRRKDAVEMTISNLSRVTVYDTFRNLDGEPESGKTIFTALVDPYLTDEEIKSEILSTSYTVAWQTDPTDGSVRQSLVCGDDPDAAPTPWMYRIDHRSDRGWKNSFTVVIPSSHPAMQTDPTTGEKSLWLGFLAPLPQASTTKIPYATQTLTADGPPAADFGRAGDYAIDESSGEPVLYGPKAADGWPAGVTLVGPQGDTGNTGPPPTLTAGTVTTLDPGHDATADVSGSDGAYSIDLGIPQGAQGDPGAVQTVNGVAPDQTTGDVDLMLVRQLASRSMTWKTAQGAGDTFSVESATNLDGSDPGLQWRFDGTPASGDQPSHQWASAGPHFVRCWLPQGLTGNLYLYGNQLTGDLAQVALPQGLTGNLYLQSNQLTGVLDCSQAPHCQRFDLDSLSLSQSDVDGTIDSVWANRAVFDATNKQLNIAGSNPAPSGDYQAATPPSTPLEKVYDLVNNYGWTITYSS
jgi:hypothetical protein